MTNMNDTGMAKRSAATAATVARTLLMGSAKATKVPMVIGNVMDPAHGGDHHVR